MRDALGYPIREEIVGRQAMFDAAPDLLAHGQWVCLNIQPDVAWPVRPQSVAFDGNDLWIIPLTLEDYPGIAMKRSPEMSSEDAERVLLRFLSLLSWREDAGFAVAYRSGGNLPRMLGLDKQRGFIIRSAFDFTEVTGPAEQGAWIALALVREARSLNHHGYAFLSYWRVLELAYPNSKDRVAWMSQALPTLSGPGVQEAMAAITSQGITDVGNHLFTSGRCAIAHATGQPIINPDDPRDALRLYRELPLVREMAIRAVEDRFGYETPYRERSKHLFELRGWKKVLGSEVVASILAGEEPGSDMPELPPINVRLRGAEPYGAFEGLVATHVAREGQKLKMAYSSGDGLCSIKFYLAFAEERLEFDIFNGLYGRDDGSVAAAAYKRDAHRFFRDYMLNGELQLWDSSSGALLSRVGAYVPVNMQVNLDGCNSMISAAQDMMEQRQSAIQAKL